jgi:hypothetical protein
LLKPSFGPETFDLPTCCLGMSPLAIECHRKAQVVAALAEVVTDQAAKETYLEIAEQWRRRAEQAEKNNW